ncbi:MAG TPA: sulfite exporter TauE/SafE family protein [Gammaproteobacteria bacterium]|nr:sulfite exporter TauE/SafE family protein [Gammaproteobacteria bacterium]
MIHDPLFYALAAVAVLIVGISKGGFGGGLGVVAVPLMSLAVPPFRAAALMLPILCAMDLVGLWAYRRDWDGANLRIMIPGAIAGIVIAAFTFGYFSEDAIRLLIGLIAVGFSLNHWLGGARREAARPAERDLGKGGFWSAVAGFTSFAAHAGGPPISLYLLPQRMDKTLFVGTTVIFFAVVNYVKLVPYAFLGELGVSNLATSVVLLPLAPIGVWLGIFLHHRVSQVWFYRVCYVFLFFTGLRLLWEGGVGIL